MTSAPQAKDFDTAIARIERRDPGSPALLSAQLAYADFLLGGAPGPCAERLVRAQQQLSSVDASPEARVMFPDGWARVADLDYRLHLARFACLSAADRANELRAAAVAARRAAELYRGVFDYHSMVVMQFDAGIALHRLGDNAAAIAALETAIDMDREYGFQDDAAENYKFLLIWRGQKAGAAQIAELMKDFPNRQTTLKFGWHPGDARIAIEDHRACLTGGQILSGRAAAAFERHTAADAGGWIVSYQHRLAHYQPGVWPTTQDSQTPPLLFAPAPLPVGFRVSTTGEFEDVTDSATFAASLISKAQELVRAEALLGKRAGSLTNEAVEDVADSLSPGMLEAVSEENYQFETAMWIGATLEQGEWYELTAPLSLPGLPRVVVPNRIQFAFTRTLPCTAGAAAQTCVEIVYRATPDQKSIDNALADMGLRHSQFDQFITYTASTDGRIITDPTTLLPYAREERLSWYESFGKSEKYKLLHSEHLISTTTYAAE